MEKEKTETTSIDQDAHLLLQIQSEFHNMGKSLQCPLCLSTFRDPVMSVCLHAFCKECISTSLKGKDDFGKKCPVCKFKCTKRGLVPSAHLADLVKGYKLSMRAFGLAPVVYSEGMGMTQLRDDEAVSSDDDESDPELDDTHKSKKTCDTDMVSKGKTKGPSLLHCHEHLEVSRAVHNVLQNAVAKLAVETEEMSGLLSSNVTMSKSRLARSISNKRSQEQIRLNSLLRDQEKIVEVDQQALVRAAVTKSRLNAPVSIGEAALALDAVKENLAEDKVVDTCMKPLSEQKVDGNPFVVYENDVQPTIEASGHSMIKDKVGEHRLTKSQNVSTQELYETSVEELREKETADRSAETLLEFENMTNLPNENKATALDDTISRCSSNTDESIEGDRNLVTDPNVDVLPIPEKLAINSLVHVQPRTWPGINKPGGVGRIICIHEDFDSRSIKYDVSYVLGGKDRLVDRVYISTMTEDMCALSNTCLPSKSKEDSRREKENAKLAEPKNKRKRPFSDLNESDIVGRIDSNTIANSTEQRDPKQTKTTTSVEPTTMQQTLDLVIDVYKGRFREELAQCELKGQSHIVNIVTSGLNESDLTLIKVFCAEMLEKNVKIKIANDFNHPKTTFCVSASEKINRTACDTENVASYRTLKLMRAALSGVPILTLPWISACIEKKELLAPDNNHIVHTLPSKNEELMRMNDEFTSDSARFGVMKLAVRFHPTMTMSKNLMDQYSALICGQFKSLGSPKKADIQLLLKESGAAVLPSASDLVKRIKHSLKQKTQSHSGFILICDDSSKDSSCGIPSDLETTLQESNLLFFVVTSNWLFDSIACGSLLSCDHFEPRSPRGKTLWRSSKRNKNGLV